MRQIVIHTCDLGNCHKPRAHLLQQVVRHRYGIRGHPVDRLDRAEHHGIARLARAHRNQNHRKLPDATVEVGLMREAPYDGIGAAMRAIRKAMILEL